MYILPAMKIFNKILSAYILFVFISSSYGQMNKDIACETINLSYMKSDQVSGVLKGMGYNVIEYETNDTLNISNYVYTPLNDLNQLPTIINFPHPRAGHLDDYGDSSSDEYGYYDYYDSGSDFDSNSYLSGSTLSNLISSDPMERLMICYDDQTKSDYYRLLEYIKNKLDIAAKQIMIDAMVIEINSNDLQSYGVGIADTTASTDIVTKINTLALSYGEMGIFTEIGRTIADEIDIEIQALMQNSSAEILSKPSVLVLDGRQARIQVGEQIPISKLPLSSAQDLYLVPDIEYLPVGITLNIRPRISDDSRHITMQVETIITEAESDASSSSTVLDAPVINNRKVESFVRLANNTPFIVGGLISSKDTDGNARVPILSKIPIIGNLFKSNTKNNQNREVIIVITPHIIEDNYSQFSKVVPQDSDMFNSFGSKLFSNSYRLKESDIYDLDFIKESDALSELRNNISSMSIDEIEKDKLASSISEGAIPGEEVLVRRMLFDIIKKSNYYSYLNPDNIIFFDENGTLKFLKDFDNEYIKSSEKNGMIFTIEVETENQSTFKRPFIKSEKYKIDSDYLIDLRIKNNISPSIILTTKNHKRMLIEALILKHLLEINEDMALSIDSFRRGLEIQFPNPEILESNIQLIDEDIVSYYYEIFDYYYAFEQKFNEVYNKY